MEEKDIEKPLGDLEKERDSYIVFTPSEFNKADSTPLEVLKSP